MTEFPYDSFIAEYYDASPVVATRQDAPIYLSAARDWGEPILELGCGTGRITLALAKGGYRVTGLDLSQRMLERCAEKREALPTAVREHVQLVHEGLTCIPLGAK